MNETNETLLPRHVVVIMDGNGRWAKQRLLPRVAGHKVGGETVRAIVTACGEKKIEALTLFAFSSENWQRPIKEVNYLMKLFFTALGREGKKLHKQNVRLRVVGDREPLDKKLLAQISAVEHLTAENTGLQLTLAVNYGGRWDITEAMRKVSCEIEQGLYSSQNITSELIQSKLVLADLPEPDLFIRTSGEKRISNFMLWQLSYTELYFTDVLWPDFDATEFEKALTYFASRERRFGCTTEQLQVEQSHA